MKKTIPLLVVLFLLLAGVVLGLGGFDALTPATQEERSQSPDAGAGQPHPTSTENRRALDPTPDESDPGQRTTASSRNFDEIYSDLIDLFSHHTYQILTRPDAEKTEYAKAASDLFEEMTLFVHNAGERAMSKIAGIQPPWKSRDVKVEERVCTIIVDLNLQFLTNTKELLDQRRRLVAQMLGYMPSSEQLAQFVYALLNEKSYLEVRPKSPSSASRSL